MSIKALGSRAIIGAYYAALEQYTGDSWISNLSMHFDSNQESETYKWLGQVPGLRQWIGGRIAKGLDTNGITIKNLEFEATLEINRNDMRLDKTGQVLIRIGDLADRTNIHWAELLSTQIQNGESQLCYDGSFYFDTTHSEGLSGTQSNKLAFTLSGFPVTVHGSSTFPSAEEMAVAILQTIQNMLLIKDNQGKVMNAMAKKFTVMVPVGLMGPAIAAVNNATLGNNVTNSLVTLASKNGFQIEVEVNPMLNWTNKFAVFRTDARVKPMIRQEEVGVEMKAIAEGSELEFEDNVHHYGVHAIRNVGFGYWQYACLAVLS